MPMTMPVSMLIIIAAVFVLAGFVKGAIGLGLPTVSIGLLATQMPPGQAVAIVIVPAVITNIWQTFVGSYLRDILRRLWPLMIGTCLGIWSGAGLMTGPYARFGTLILGALLVTYALVSLSKIHLSVSPVHEKWIGAVAGVFTGLICAATGVQVIPSMPFLQAIGMEKDELVQALGVFFTTSTIALSFNLADAGLLTVSIALPGIIALLAAFAGMVLGQSIRSRMDPSTFRRWFLVGLLLLGLYLAGNTIIALWTGRAANPA